MKLHLAVDLKKLVQDMRGPKGTAALTEEFNRISRELGKLRDEVRPQAKAQLKKAERRYQDLVKKLHAAQKDLDKEVNKRVNIVKKQAKDVEKNLGQYKKLALQQKNKLEAAFTKKKATSKKTATSGRPGAKRTAAKSSSGGVKTAAKTAAKRTSKKASSKKA